MTFDELSTLKQPSASLRTALDKISAALGSVGDAGQQARSVVDELRVSLRAAAAQSVKSARSLAKFDEINRLSAPAEDKTAAPEKQKKAAEAAAKAEKAARSTTGTAARRSGTAGSDLSGLTAVWQSVLESLRGAWADFWAYLQEFLRRSPQRGRRFGRGFPRRQPAYGSSSARRSLRWSSPRWHC